MKRIAIIGGGYSGVAICSNLIKSSQSNLEIYIFDKSMNLAKGVAYSTKDNLHLLNVPAILMGAFEDDQQGFYNWLSKNKQTIELNYDIKIHKYLFAPRKLYGQYLEEIFEESKKIAKEKQIDIHFIKEEIIDIEKISSKKYQIFSKDNEYEFDKIVLATGGYRPQKLNFVDPDVYSNNNFIQNIWQDIDKIDFNQNEFFIIGTGLTMIDIVLTIFKKNKNAKVTCFSRNGLLPQIHDVSAYDDNRDLLGSIKTKKLSDLIYIIKKAIKAEKNIGNSGQRVLSNLRPQMIEIWNQFGVDKKQKFLKRFFSFYSVFRHRMPVENYEKLKYFFDNGNLSIKSGHIKSITNDNSNLKFLFEGKNYSPSVIINCTGICFDLSKLENKLIDQIIAKKYLVTDELNLGFRYDKNLNIYPIGTLRFGELFETISVIEIRKQADEISKEIVNDL